MSSYYTQSRASVHRGVYPLAVEATDLFEGARDRIAALAAQRPWRRRCSPPTPQRRSTSSRTRGAARTSAPAISSSSPRWSTTRTSCRGSCCVQSAAPSSPTSRVLDDGRLDLDSLDATARACAEAASRSPTSPTCSGRSTRSAEIARRAHDAGAVVVVDGSQAVPQIPVDLARDRRRLLRLDRPQGLRADRDRRPARPPGAAGGDAAVHRRRPHDPQLSASSSRPGRSCPGSSRPAPRRSPRRSGSAPRSTGSRRSGSSGSASTRRRSPPRRWTRLARRARAHDPRARGGRRPRRGRSRSSLDGAHPHDVGEILGRERRLRPRRATTAPSR